MAPDSSAPRVACAREVLGRDASVGGRRGRHHLNDDNLRRLAGVVQSVWEVSAADVKSIGYMARLFVQTNLPHRDPGNVIAWTRKNGDFTLQITPGVTIPTREEPARRLGIPCGTYPRLVLSWITTEALRTRSRELVLGRSLAEFLRKLGIQRTGGGEGTIRRLREQMGRLFGSTITWSYQRGPAQLEAGIRPFEGVFTFWNPAAPEIDGVLSSKLVLNGRLFDEILRSSVPLDMRVVRELARQHNCLGIDLYGWLTHKQHQLTRTGKTVLVPWASLEAQLGGDYGRTRDFKRRFLSALTVVGALYPGGKATPAPRGLMVRPGAPSIGARVA